ncbi:MAG: FAD-dependent oxidoreductase [Actinomycetota bacterium]
MTAGGGFTRAAGLERLGTGAFDVLVVGGGITGAGVALDAAARGLRTALVERDDFASGTSSKSSKLVHGGLRYLQQREFRLVRENLAERQRLLANAPHLVRPLDFVIPLLGAGGVVSSAVARGYSTALWGYDLSGGLRIGRRHHRLTPAQVQAALPTLRGELVAAGFAYPDAWADDARLTLAVVRTAVDRGAVAVNHLGVASLLKDGTGRVRGAVLADGSEVRAGVVVNAGGVWADRVAALDSPASAPSLRPAKGIHVTVERRRLPCEHAAVLPVPGDRRSIFVVPWGERVYLGTTDTEYAGPLDDPQCTPDDVAYLLGAANAVLAQPLTEADVVGTWAGLRPLLDRARSRRTADLSRRHRVTTGPGSVVTVTGGKLTTYRRMAADAVDEAVRVLGAGPRRGPTRALRLHGAGRGPWVGAGPDPAAEHLRSRHGADAPAVARLVAGDAGLGLPLVAGLPYLRAEAVHAVRAEMATTLDDVLSRRTRARILARDASVAAAPDVARLIGPELGWTAADAEREVAAYTASVDRERAAAGLRPTPAGP